MSSTTAEHCIITGRSLSIEDIVEVARLGSQVVVSDDARFQVEQSRRKLLRILDSGKVIYGVNTGFGALCDRFIAKENASRLQENLVRSHATNVGEVFAVECCRAAMLSRLNTLSMGLSGASPSILDYLVFFLNNNITPCVPEQGSVGASGDLGPLAHIALALLGEGKVLHGDRVVNASAILELFEKKPLELAARDGLALINGTAMMTGVAALCVHDSQKLLLASDLAASLSIQALMIPNSPFQPWGNQTKLHPGQDITARHMMNLLEGSQLSTSGKELESRLERELASGVASGHDQLQAGYSVRCIPQVHGAGRDAIAHVRTCIERELNSCDDNPLIPLDSEDIFHGGNFHGQPVALPVDYLAIAVTQIGGISERRINRLLHPALNNGLPPFLITGEAGLESGLAGLQYTATSLAAENRSLCSACSIQSIPSNADNQDFVSMGLIGARRLRQIIRNVRYVIAIELYAASVACSIRGAERLAHTTRAGYEAILAERSRVDGNMSAAIESITKLLLDEAFDELTASPQ